MSLSKSYLKTYSFPVELINAPVDKQLISDSLSIKTTINSKGWDILFKKIKGRKLVIDLKGYPNTAELEISNAKVLIQENFPDLDIREVNPTFFNLKFKQLQSKKVPIKINADKKFAPNFYFNEDAKTKPDSIKITSDLKTLSTINYLETESIIISEKDSVVRNINLKIPRNVKAEIEKIDVYFDIVEFVEKELLIPIHIDNNLKKIDIIIYPQEIKLKCLVPIKIYEKISPSDFYISADFNNIEVRNNNQLIINVTDKPESAKNIQLEKDKVEFIIYQ